MQPDFNDLTLSWKAAKENLNTEMIPVDKILPLAQKRKRSSLFFHFTNIGILSVLVVVLVLCFQYLFPFRDPLSKTGEGMMIGSLIARIIVEVFSTIKSFRIHLSDDVWNVSGQTLDFYLFRKKIHGPVTILLVAIYSLGFYFLTPEFSKYLPLPLMILIDLSYVVGAIILITQIRKGIKKELNQLISINDLREKINLI